MSDFLRKKFLYLGDKHSQKCYGDTKKLSKTFLSTWYNCQHHFEGTAHKRKLSRLALVGWINLGKNI